MFELSLALHSFVALLDIWHTIRLQLTSDSHHSTAEVVVALAPSLIDGLGPPVTKCYDWPNKDPAIAGNHLRTSKLAL